MTELIDVLKSERYEEDKLPGAIAPERVLLAALLERAILDLVVPTCKFERYEERALRRWFLDKESEPFSFCWVCEHLSFSPAVILTRLAPYLRLLGTPQRTERSRGVFYRRSDKRQRYNIAPLLDRMNRVSSPS